MKKNSVNRYLHSFSYLLWLLSWALIYIAYIALYNGLELIIGWVINWPMLGYILALFVLMFIAKIAAALMSLPIVAIYTIVGMQEMNNSRAKALIYFGVAYLTWGLVFLSVRDFYYLDKSDTKVLFMGIYLLWGTWILLYRLNNMITYVRKFGNLKGYNFKNWKG